jgi:glycine oxidase
MQGNHEILISARRAVVVVGGGVVGCAVAFELARRGIAVTLVERDAVAAHASGFNAGNVNPLHGTPPELIPRARKAFAIHQEVRTALAELGCARFVAAPVRRLHLATSEADRPHLAETVSLFAGTPGFAATWLDRDALAACEQRLAPEVIFGVLSEGNLSVDSGDFTRSLAAGAARLGARIVTATACGVVTQANRVTGLATSQGVIACDGLVLATGPFVAEANTWLGIDVPVAPVKGELLRMRLPEGAPRFDLTWGFTSLYRRRDDEVWVGSTFERSGLDAAPTPAARSAMLESAAMILPDIRRAELLDHVAALRPMATPDAPLAERVAGWQNVYVANGGGSKGVLLSVFIARAISSQLMERQAVETVAAAIM